MIFEISKYDILSLLVKQLSSFFSISCAEKRFLKVVFDRVLERLEKNFKVNSNKYYSAYLQGKNETDTYFSPYHSGQWTIFLYYMSYELGHFDGGEKRKTILLADKVYYLNKIMNSCDLYHQVELPDHFRLDHPQGSVMGRAKYGNGFSFSQCCTVGNNNGIYPQIGENCKMCMNSAILGKCKIGDNVILGAGAIVKDQDIPSNSIVFGHSPNLIIKQRNKLQV